MRKAEERCQEHPVCKEVRNHRYLLHVIPNQYNLYLYTCVLFIKILWLGGNKPKLLLKIIWVKDVYILPETNGSISSAKRKWFVLDGCERLLYNATTDFQVSLQDRFPGKEVLGKPGPQNILSDFTIFNKPIKWSRGSLTFGEWFGHVGSYDHENIVGFKQWESFQFSPSRNPILYEKATPMSVMQFWFVWVGVHLRHLFFGGTWP